MPKNELLSTLLVILSAVLLLGSFHRGFSNTTRRRRDHIWFS